MLDFIKRTGPTDCRAGAPCRAWSSSPTDDVGVPLSCLLQLLAWLLILDSTRS